MNIGLLLWLVPVLFTIHNLEEALTMRKYGTGHFRNMQRGQFAAAVILLTLLAVSFIYLGTNDEYGVMGRILAIFIQASLCINALVHMIASIRFRRYTPGVITAVLIYIPFSLYLFDAALKTSYVTGMQLAWAFVAGVVLQLPLVLGALFVGGWLVRVFRGRGQK